MKRIISTLLGIALNMIAMTQIASADAVLYPDGSVRYPVISRTIPSVNIQQGDLCDIVLQPGERINQAVISDSLRWKMTDGTSENDTPHIFLKPVAAGLNALLTVTTTRHTYHLRINSVNGSGREFIGFYYPAPPAPPRRFQPRPRPTPYHQPLAWTCARRSTRTIVHGGARDFWPISVCNDGAHTYVNLGKNRWHVTDYCDGC